MHAKIDAIREIGDKRYAFVVLISTLEEEFYKLHKRKRDDPQM